MLAWPRTSSADLQLREIADEIADLNPDIEIRVPFEADYESTLRTAVESRDMPDVFLVTGSMLPWLVEEGVVESIPDGWIDDGRLLRSATQAVAVNGVRYCFPHSVGALALVYNKAMFDVAGVEYPSAAWTWQEMASAATDIVETGAAAHGIVLDPDLTAWLPFYLQAGGEMPEASSTSLVFVANPAERASAFVAQLYADGAAQTPQNLEASWSGEAFANGKAAMTITGDWIVPYLEAEWPTLRYGASELPAGPAGKATIAFASCLAVSQTAPIVSFALQLAAQLTAPEVLSSWSGADGGGPSVYVEPDVADAVVRPEYAGFLRGMRYAQLWQLRHYTVQQAGLYAEAVEEVISGEITPDEFWPALERAGVVSSIPQAP